jgi:citrate lyase subunit beta / citryl-CoA lyase
MQTMANTPPGTQLTGPPLPHRNGRALQLPANLSRSWLLTSAAKRTAFAAALTSEADSVILDLEDAVPATEKAHARKIVTEALATGASTWVRVNGPESEYWADDLAALSQAPRLQGIMLSMTETADQIAATASRLPGGTPIIALIESAMGIENAAMIATAPSTFRLAFGVGDFRRDTGTADTPAALAYARSRLVIASRVGGLPGPIDGPSVDAAERELLEASRLSREMGMTGKLCLAPAAAETINKGLSPSEAERQWATDLLAAHESGAAPEDGSYLPRLFRARKILSLATAYGLCNC